jgi:SAM-dependent methyltransferase
MVASALCSVRSVGDVSVDAGRGPGQLAWYRFASRFIAGKTVLDAGCGLGMGLDILRKHALGAAGQDLDPRLARQDVTIGPLENIPSKSVDVVVSIDVIEHVPDDAGFVRQLGRIARQAVFVTTPNWTITRCTWPYHLREYTPLEFETLLRQIGKVQLYKGNGAGTLVHPVRYRRAYHALNRLRQFPLTAFSTRCFSRFLLPEPARLHSHNAALITVR